MTNEEYIKAIELRQSRRTYKQKPLSKEIMDMYAKEAYKAMMNGEHVQKSTLYKTQNIP